MSKRDRFGIHTKIENLCLEALDHGLRAVYLDNNSKLNHLKELRIIIEALKRLLRLEQELDIITPNLYFHYNDVLREASRMTNGWIKYMQRKNSP